MKKLFSHERGVEKQARRALRRVVFYRFVGDVLFFLPVTILAAIETFVQTVARFLRRLEMTVFLFELDAARTYKLLTGADLGTATGEPARYGLMNNPEMADDIQAAFLEQRIQGGQSE